MDLYGHRYIIDNMPFQLRKLTVCMCIYVSCLLPLFGICESASRVLCPHFFSQLQATDLMEWALEKVTEMTKG